MMAAQPHTIVRLVDVRECHADACDQGRKPCPCPEACEVSADPHLRSVFWRWWLACMLAIAATVIWAVWS